VIGKHGLRCFLSKTHHVNCIPRSYTMAANFAV
jgi:hypothetical protein